MFLRSAPLALIYFNFKKWHCRWQERARDPPTQRCTNAICSSKNMGVGWISLVASFTESCYAPLCHPLGDLLPWWARRHQIWAWSSLWWTSGRIEVRWAWGRRCLFGHRLKRLRSRVLFACQGCTHRYPYLGGLMPMAYKHVHVRWSRYAQCICIYIFYWMIFPFIIKSVWEV